MSRAAPVRDRVDALAQALVAGTGALPEPLRERGADLVERAGQRLALAGETTVVALAGATGSGKSSLFNALAGAELARPGARRPTTAAPEAVAWSADDAGVHALLDWLQVQVRHAVPAPATLPDELVLLDLPDHDSVVVEHRSVAERLYQRVDLLVWVVDPQKYADGVLHERYLRPLAALAPVMVLVLNHSDRLSQQQRTECVADLRRLAAQDGLGAVPVLALSARTGEGVDELRALLAQSAARRRAATDRVAAEVADVAKDVVAVCGPARRAKDVDDARLVEAFEEAAGVPVVLDAVRRSTSRRARAATGWPPVRWLTRLRADPLRRLHLRTGVPAHPELSRTSVPPAGPAAQAGAAAAVRQYLDGATVGAPDDWVLHVRARVDTRGLAQSLDQAVAGTTLVQARRPVWWSLVAALQWVGLAACAGGALWLLGLAIVDRALLVQSGAPVWRGLPVPTWLVVAGLVLAVVLSGLGAAFGAWGARRAAARARRALRVAVREVAREQVVAPVGAGLAQLDACRAAAQRAMG